MRSAPEAEIRLRGPDLALGVGEGLPGVEHDGSLQGFGTTGEEQIPSAPSKGTFRRRADRGAIIAGRGKGER